MADHNQAICVDEWELDETYGGVYPKGAREKDVYFSPKEPSLPFIKPNHRILKRRELLLEALNE